MSTELKTETSQKEKPKKEVPLISQDQVAEYKITEKDLGLLGSARSLYSKGKTDGASSKKTAKKEESGVKATTGYKALNALVFAPAKSKMEQDGKKPEEIVEAVKSNKTDLRKSISKLTEKEVWDYNDVSKVVKAAMKVLLDTPKPAKSGD